jgi:DNA-binding transcriptional LysR family regulator
MICYLMFGSLRNRVWSDAYGILPEWLIDEAVADGRLVHLWAQKHSSVHLYAVYMNRAFLNSKIRLLMDFLAKRL